LTQTKKEFDMMINVKGCATILVILLISVFAVYAMSSVLVGLIL